MKYTGEFVSEARTKAGNVFQRNEYEIRKLIVNNQLTACPPSCKWFAQVILFKPHDSPTGCVIFITLFLPQSLQRLSFLPRVTGLGSDQAGWAFEARQFSEPTFLTIPVIFNFGCTWQIPGSHPPMINLSRVWSGSWDVLFLFGCTGSYFWHVGSSSPTRDRSQFPCIGSVESQPLVHQGSPWAAGIFLKFPSSLSRTAKFENQ